MYVYVCSYVPLPSADAAVNPIQMNLLCFFCSSLAWQLIDVGCSWVIFPFTSLFSLNLRWVGTIFCTITNSHNSFFFFFCFRLRLFFFFFFCCLQFHKHSGNRLMIYIAFFGGASKQTGSNKFKQAELLLSVHDHNGAASHIQPHQKNCRSMLQASMSHFTRNAEPEPHSHSYTFGTATRIALGLIPSDFFQSI